MGLGRRWRSWWAVDVVATLLCLATVSMGTAAAQGRTAPGAQPGANGRGSGTGRQAPGQFVSVRTDRCPTSGPCERVVRALESRPYPRLLASGEDLRKFAASRSTDLVVLVCPCGQACLDLNSFGWQERNLGWSSPTSTAGSDVPINFHFAKNVTQLLMSIERLDFRVKWSRAIDGSGDSRLSEAITSYGKGPATAAGVCRE